MLEPLGVEPGVEAVYRALLGRPSATAALLAEALQRPADDVERALAELVASGLALHSDDGYVAAPPAVALGALITERRDGLRLAERALATLAEEHRAAAAGRSISELIEVVVGVDAVRHRYQQVQQAATTQLRSFVTAPFVVVGPGENSAEPAAAGRGVRIRAVLERAVLSEPGAHAEATDSLRNGLELRVVEELPLKLVLADADLALVPLVTTTDAEPGAVLLQRSGLVDALDALFEATWQRAYPLELSSFEDDAVPDNGTGERLSLLERQILSLLLAGLSDQAVATQLGLSLRTLQRHLRRLQDAAGVNTRMQLGWYAARNGWA